MIYISSDHAGFSLKTQFIQYFKENNIEYCDLGCNSTTVCDYPEYGYKLGEKVISNSNSLGIGICGSGVGICMAANKIKGIRAVNINNESIAELSKKHNNANVICFGARLVNFEDALKYYQIFTKTKFESRHQSRIDLLNSK